MESPGYVQISLAAAITLGFMRGRFRREAKLTGLNLLLTYEDGCLGRCSYCGLSRGRKLLSEEEKTFIRVRWPVYPLEEVIARTKTDSGQLKRVCISMLTHPRAFADMNYIIGRFHKEIDLPISALVSPTTFRKSHMLAEVKAAGADMVGIAVDVATPELFARHRGPGVQGPHRWKHFWQTTAEAVKIFGPYKVGVHLIVGLGETEQEMVQAIQKAQDLEAHTHLFSFFPEGGTPLDSHPQPSYGQYRRIQLARYIINGGYGRSEALAFNAVGQIVDFGLDTSEFVASGEPFMTSGCPGRDGRLACNRPFGNERPSRPIRNYPFSPEVEDIELIRFQLGQGLMGRTDGRETK